MNPFKRVYRVGTLPDYSEERPRLPYFVCAEYRPDGELSLQGVEGPLSNGNCRGSCGQASDGLTAEGLEPGEGWSKASAARLAEIWEAWHLNHLRAYDSAMKASDWHERAKLEMRGYHFTLTAEASKAAREAEAAAVAALKAGEPFQPSAAQTEAALRPYSLTIWTYADESEPAPPSAAYERKRSIAAFDAGAVLAAERKTLGWLRPSEHSDGLLGRIHPVSGNAYGGKWYGEEVPESVLAELQAFPAYSGGLSWFDWHGAAEEETMAAVYGQWERKQWSRPMAQRERKERLTKEQWYSLGGLAVPGLFRKQSKGGAWRYYRSLAFGEETGPDKPA